MAARKMVILPPEKYKALIENQRETIQQQQQQHSSPTVGAGDLDTNQKEISQEDKWAGETTAAAAAAAAKQPKPPPGIPAVGLDSVFKEWYSL